MVVEGVVEFVQPDGDKIFVIAVAGHKPGPCGVYVQQATPTETGRNPEGTKDRDTGGHAVERDQESIHG